MDPRFNIKYCIFDDCNVGITMQDWMQGRRMCKEHYETALDEHLRKQGILAKPKRELCEKCGGTKKTDSPCTSCRTAIESLSKNLTLDADELFGEFEDENEDDT